MDSSVETNSRYLAPGSAEGPNASPRIKADKGDAPETEEQELFFDAVYRDKTMRLRDKARWLHASASDYWTRLEAAEAELAATRPLVEAAVAYGAACETEEAAAGGQHAREFSDAWFAAVETLERTHDALTEAAIAYAARQQATEAP